MGLEQKHTMTNVSHDFTQRARYINAVYYGLYCKERANLRTPTSIDRAREVNLRIVYYHCQSQVHTRHMIYSVTLSSCERRNFYLTYERYDWETFKVICMCKCIFWK